MGWKAVKEHYNVRHIVQVTDQGICIGSGYMPSLIVISLEGELVKRYEDGSNADLSRYQAEMLADPATLRELVLAKDSFSESIPVFTFDGCRIVEAHCEAFGWPNATHDGALMYENAYFRERAQAVAHAKANAAAAVRWREDQIKRNQDELAHLRQALAMAEADVTQLDIDYPAAPTRPA